MLQMEFQFETHASFLIVEDQFLSDEIKELLP